MAQDRTPKDTSLSYEQALEKTVPSDDFGPDGLRRSLAATADDTTRPPSPVQFLDKTASDPTAGRTESATDITDFVQTDWSPTQLAAEEPASTRRFELLDQVGKGATGRVFALRDHSLRRVIAVKFLHRSREHKKGVREQFVHEAQVTAMLEHPNIMPVYDIGITDRRQVYFTMKRIAGMAVGDAIRAARAGGDVPDEFQTLDGRVRVFLKVCDALTYAHARGFVHQDVKPDNIMIGEYGEVLLLDWGSSFDLESGEGLTGKRLYGTPAFMSPEQARRERADARSDLYCVGTSFFQALLLRHPTWSKDPEVFWAKKRRGEIDPLTAEERKRIPRALLRIVLKAMAPDPADRYQSVEDLSRDLKRYQAGLAVSAYRETLVEQFYRWYRRNRRIFWISGLSTLAVTGVAALLLHEKVQEMITWRPYASYDFGDASRAEDLADTWRVYRSEDWSDPREVPFSVSDAWTVDSGALVGDVGQGYTNISFARSIPGDIRVEWDITPLRSNLNLNGFLGGETRAQGYTFHVGSSGNPTQVTLTRQRGFMSPVARVFLDSPIRVGTTYHMRMEKEGEWVRLYMEGRLLIEYHDLTGLSGESRNTFGFENSEYNRVRVDNVHVHYHPLPLRISPLATADRFFQKGLYHHALGEYRDLIVNYPSHAVSVTAAYKAGQCLLHLDSLAAADSVFGAFVRANAGHELSPLAMHARYELRREQGDTTAADSMLSALGQHYPGHQLLHNVIRDMSQRRLNHLGRITRTWVRDTSDDGSNAAWLQRESARLQQWADRLGVPRLDNRFLNQAAIALYQAGAIGMDELMHLFPEQRDAQAYLLNRSGRGARVLRDYADYPGDCSDALRDLGDYRGVLERYPQKETNNAKALLMLGRYEELLRRYPGQVADCAEATWRLGRIDELTQRYPGMPEEVLARLGKHAFLLEATQTDVFRLTTNLLTYCGRPDTVMQVLDRRGNPRQLQVRLRYSKSLGSLGRFQEVLDRYGHSHNMEESCAEAYRCMGRARESMRRYPDLVRTQTLGWLALGHPDSVIDLRQRDPDHAIDALWLTDRTDDFLRWFGHRRHVAAAVHLRRKAYTTVLDEYPDQREACAKALLGMHRYAEVLKRYPGQREACWTALYHTGRAEEAFAAYPESRPEYARRLLEQGRYDDVAAGFRDQVWEYTVALIALGRDSDLPVSEGLVRLSPAQAMDAAALRAIRESAQGNDHAAVAALDSIPFVDFEKEEDRFARLLLKPILSSLAGHAETAASAYRHITGNYRGVMGQRLWHDAAFLSGTINEDAFLSQPLAYYAEERLVLWKAVRDDIAGRRASALRRYRTINQTPHCRYPRLSMVTDISDRYETIFSSDVLHAFVRWRIGEPEPTGPVGPQRDDGVVKDHARVPVVSDHIQNGFFVSH